MDKLNLDAYYYSFEPTGVDAVDTILSAVANAGAGYHNTADWRDQYDDGSSPLSDMQEAAEKSAEAFRALIAENERLRSDYESLAAFNPDWDRLKAAQESLREYMEIIAQLKAENAELTGQLEYADENVVALEKQNKALMREYEPMRKDAERYRWLRSQGMLRESCGRNPDKAIDDAIAKEPANGQAT